jgi:hypothetical protein
VTTLRAENLERSTKNRPEFVNEVSKVSGRMEDIGLQNRIKNSN